MRRKIGLLAFLFLLVILSGWVQAADGDLVEFTLSCSGYTSRAGYVILNRDNTGNNAELFYVQAFDGAGTQINAPELWTQPVGSSHEFVDGAFFVWETAPEYNPLVLAVVSPAGNGLPDEIAYYVTGTCVGLPDATGAGAYSTNSNRSVSPFVPDGNTSAPFAPNSIPPRPINPPGAAESQPGYGIVAADNLYIRTGPGLAYAPVGILDEGTTLIMRGRNHATAEDDSDILWWYVEVGGTRGWVKGNLIVLRGDVSAVPVVPIHGAPNLPRVISGFPTYPIFANPDRAETLCHVAGGLDYIVLGKNDNPFNAYKVQAPCADSDDLVTGWVLAEQVTLRNPGGLVIPITNEAG
jgi:hypothetical protein